MTEFSGKAAIVMGASSPGGIGEATAKRLASGGAKVVVAGIGKELLEQLAAEINGTAYEADITSEAEMKALVDFTVDTYGEFHLAVNHAGVTRNALIRDMDEELLLKMTKINFFGTVWFIKSVAEKIADNGAIVTTASMSAYDPVRGTAAYASAKRAGDRVVELAAIEYSEKRLRINSIVPPVTDTPMLRGGAEEYGIAYEDFVKPFQALTPLGRIAKPEDLAAMTCMMLRDDFFETGQHFFCTGGARSLGHPRTLG